eukprot:m.10865 g.10865  ORF g.10865 m.10865 type:complete len:63 (-) comp6257_c0_seq1:879-1067(-)
MHIKRRKEIKNKKIIHFIDIIDQTTKTERRAQSNPQTTQDGKRGRSTVLCAVRQERQREDQR